MRKWFADFFKSKVFVETVWIFYNLCYCYLFAKLPHWLNYLFKLLIDDEYLNANISAFVAEIGRASCRERV